MYLGNLAKEDGFTVVGRVGKVCADSYYWCSDRVVRVTNESGNVVATLWPPANVVTNEEINAWIKARLEEQKQVIRACGFIVW